MAFFQTNHFLGLLFLMASWEMPSHFPPWVSWHSEVPAFLAVLLIAWYGLIIAVKQGLSQVVSLPLTVLPLIALALVILLQTLTRTIPFIGDTVVYSLYLILCILCMVLSRANGSAPKTYTVLASTLLLGAFLSAVVAFAQVFELWEGSALISRMPQLRRPGGNLGQPNQLATLLLMGLASLIFLYESKKLGALASALLALTLLTGVAATESRTGVLSLFFLMLWWFAKRRSLGFRLSPWVVTCGGAAFLALFWFWPRLLGLVLQTSGFGEQVNTSVGYRWLVWPQLIEAVLQRPWWGWGMGQVSTAHNAVVSAYAVSEPYTYAHNIVLDLAIGIGLPLTALLVLVTGIWLWRRVRSAHQLAPWYCLALILPVAVHSMLEFPFAYAYFLVPVMFAVGALEGAVGAKPAFRLGVKPALVMLLVTTGVMAWSVVEYIAIEEDFRIVPAFSLPSSPPASSHCPP